MNHSRAPTSHTLRKRWCPGALTFFILPPFETATNFMAGEMASHCHDLATTFLIIRHVYVYSISTQARRRQTAEKYFCTAGKQQRANQPQPTYPAKPGHPQKRAVCTYAYVVMVVVAVAAAALAYKASPGTENPLSTRDIAE